MSERLAVVLALTPVAEHAIEAQLFGPDATLEPHASLAEADELEAETSRVDARAVLLSPALSGLTPGHCARIRARGLRLIGIALDQREHDALLDLAVDAIIGHDDPAALLAAISADDSREPLAFPPTTASPGGQRAGGGNVVAIVGSKGSPGASELAASLAARAAQQWPCVLVELDLLGGGLDVRLGADPQRGSLLGLLHATRSDEPALRELLERWLTSRPGWPPVLLGPPDPGAAAGELARPGALNTCLHALTTLYPLCLVDTGHLLGHQAELPSAARAHREALVSADAVVLVLGARDQQLRAGLAQLDLLLDQLDLKPERLRIVLNGQGGPGSSDRSLEPTLLERLGERGLTVDSRIPWDGRALRRASRRGQPFALAHRHGGYAKAVGRFLEELFLPATPAPRARKHKLTPPPVEAIEEEVALPWRS